MELEQLRYFAQVVDSGSFSRAAAAMNVTQPSVSRQIRQLEVELRCNLFHRHGRGIRLTDAGQGFLATVRNILRELDQACQVVRTERGVLTGTFVLGMTPALAALLTVPLLREFGLRFPHAHLSVVEGMSRTIHDRLLAGTLDAAVLRDRAPSSLIRIEPLLAERLCLVAPRSSPWAGAPHVPFAALARLPIVLPSAPNSVRSVVEAQAAKAGVQLDIAHDIDGVDTMLDLVHEGFGYNVAPASVVKVSRWSRALCATPLTAPELTSTVALATPARQSAGALHDAALRLIREVSQELLNGRQTTGGADAGNADAGDTDA